MQEQINEKAVALSIKAAKLTSMVLAKSISKFLSEMEKQKKNKDSRAPNEVYKGKQSVKQLTGQGANLSSIEIQDDGIKKFGHIAKKYGVDFAVKKDPAEKNKYLVFFKAKDADVLNTAFKEYTAKILKKTSRH